MGEHFVYALRGPGGLVTVGSIRGVHGNLNAFIVIPEIIAGAFFNRVVNFLIPRLPASIDVRLAVVMIGGGALLLAALLMLRVKEQTEAPKARVEPKREEKIPISAQV